jgi:hypothetical protein
MELRMKKGQRYVLLLMAMFSTNKKKSVSFYTKLEWLTKRRFIG